MYIRGLVLLLFCLSFFPPHATSCIFIQYNYVSLYLCSPVFTSSAQPSWPPCPRPRPAKPSHLRPHRAKSRPSRAPIWITKSCVSHRALPSHRVAAPTTPVPAPELPSTPAASSLDSVSIPRPSVTPNFSMLKVNHASSGVGALFAQRLPCQAPPYPPPFPSHFFLFVHLYFLRWLSPPGLPCPFSSCLSPRLLSSSPASTLPRLASLPLSSSVL
jgi:hypothetical protein